MTNAARREDRKALDRLYPLVYQELRGIARRQLGRELPDHTLNTTALVHEAYLKMVDQQRVDWRSHAQVLGLAATAMRRILVDYARQRGALKRGGGDRPVPLDECTVWVDERAEMLVALDEALDRLAALDARLARVVECRYFGGLTEEETADVLAFNVRTVRRDWTKARGWLYQALCE